MRQGNNHELQALWFSVYQWEKEKMCDSTQKVLKNLFQARLVKRSKWPKIAKILLKSPIIAFIGRRWFKSRWTVYIFLLKHFFYNCLSVTQNFAVRSRGVGLPFHTLQTPIHRHSNTRLILTVLLSQDLHTLRFLLLPFKRNIQWQPYLQKHARDYPAFVTHSIYSKYNTDYIFQRSVLIHWIANHFIT